MSRSTRTGTEKRKRRREQRRVKKQIRAANVRARYGPSKKPAPVVVKSLDGEVRAIVSQKRLLTPQTTAKPDASPLDKLARMAGYKSYQGYLRSDHWRDIRERVKQRDGQRCVRCQSKARLQVHHLSYGVLGAERIEELETLCDRCHRKEHR